MGSTANPTGLAVGAAFVAMALMPGRPLLYNGQEVESPQVLNLFEPQPVAWEQPGAAESRAFYTRVVGLARDSAITGHPLSPIETTAPQEVIAYARGDVAVLVNTRGKEVKFALPRANGARDLLSDGTQQGDTVALGPYGTRVLRAVPR